MLFGLSGTIGSLKEQHLLKEIYKVDLVTIPTAKTKQFTEEEAILCSSTDEWTSAIWENAMKQIKRNRSVLIICETVRDVITIKQKYDQSAYPLSARKIHIYKRDYEELTVSKGLQPGNVIISTNLAGRGTDIVLTKELISAGGLHVCLTFFPNNNRVEEQAYGRAARKGEPGSAQMIFKSCTEESSSNVRVIDLKKQRDVTETLRISDIKNYNKRHVLPQERSFKEFHNVYKEISSSDNKENIKTILLQVSLDQWAFWLEKNKNSLDYKSSNCIKEQLSKLCTKEFANCIDDPSQLSKLGLILIENKQYDQAIILFDRVIKDEPSFSENARYYKLCAKLAMKSLIIEDVIKELNLIVKLLKERIQSLVLSANIIDYLKKENPINILQVESFKEQHLNICRIYEVFLEHIYSLTGQEFGPESLAIPTIIDEECAFRIYNDLIKENVITMPEVKKDVSDEDLKFLSLYGLVRDDIEWILEDLREIEVENFLEFEQYFLKELEDSSFLPSRELFWEELLSREILVNEVDLHKLNYVDPSLIDIIKSISILNHLEEYNQIWLYQLEEIDCFGEKNLVLTKKEELEREIGENKCELLQHKYVVYQNKLATLVKVQGDVNFDFYDFLLSDDFLRIKVSDDIALEIIRELEEKLVIRDISENEYILLINPRDIVNIKLSRFEAYSEDVVNLLSRCFAFRLALQKSWELLENQMNSDDPICLPLQIRLQNRIMQDFYDHGIIKKSAIKPGKEKSVCDTLTTLYPKQITIKQVESLFSDVFHLDTTRQNVIECLIECNWLTPVFPQIPYTDKKYIFQNKNVKELPPAIRKHLETIEFVLKRHENLSSSCQQCYIKQFVDQHASAIHELKTPSFSLIPLYDILKERKLPLGECSTFSLNGFDKLIIMEELRYSRYMIMSTFVATMLGVTQITIGAIYGIHQFVEGGVADLNFVVSCLFSGHFSWKEYRSNKVASLIQIAYNFAFSSGKFGSLFGQNLSLSSMWSSAVRSEIKSAAVEIVRYSTTTCTIAASHAAIDKLLEPKLDELGKKIVERIIGDFDNIIENHPAVEAVINVSHLHKEKSKKLIVMTSDVVIEDYKNKNDKDLLLIFNKLHITITSSYSSLKKLINMKQMSWTDLILLFPEVSKIIENVTYLINCTDYLKNIQPQTITSEIMDSLFVRLNDLEIGNHRRLESGVFDVEGLLNEVLNHWKQEIREVCEYNVNRCIIHPLKNSLKNMFVKSLSQKNNLAFVSNLKNKGLSELKLGELKLTCEGSNSTKTKNCNWFLCKEYDDCLTELFSAKKQSVLVFYEILKNSVTADISFIKQFCTIIPMVLKTKGLTLPLLQIIIESDSIIGTNQQIVGSTNTPESDVLTITIIPNDSFLANLKRNKIVLENIFDALYLSVIQFYPALRGHNGQYIRDLVTEAIEEDSNILQHIDNNIVQPSNRQRTVRSAIDLKKTESQEFYKIKECVTEGFKIALVKINHHLYLCHPYFKYFKLTLEDFMETKQELIPNKQFSANYFSCYATEYELVVPLQKNSLLVDYKITMSLKISTDRTKRLRPKKHCPNSPHIEYKINPLDCSEALDKESFEGHVLLGFQLEESIYSLKDCRFAGELVLPTV